MIYVACPFWHPDEEIRNQRMSILTDYCQNLLKDEKPCISAILYRHGLIGEQNPNKIVSKFTWGNLCLELIGSCKEMHVLCVSGWMESEALTNEINFAKNNNIIIKYINLT